MKNKHVGVNFDDRDIPQKALPRENVEGPKTRDLEGVVKNLQNKNISYNKNYYQKVERKDLRAIDPDDIDDPRTLDDIEQENLDLKEQMIHQMMTLEQYLSVAYLWHAENETGFNPFESENSQLELLDLQNQING